MRPFKTVVLDVDGVLTDCKFYYSESGKVLKVFGPDDNDALKLLDQFFEIVSYLRTIGVLIFLKKELLMI